MTEVARKRFVTALIGDRLGYFIRRAGLTSESLARKIGRSVHLIQALQTGFIEAPDLSIIQELCKELGITEQMLKIIDVWTIIESRSALDRYCARMGLTFEEKCQLAIEAAKPSRSAAPFLTEAHWNSARNRLLNKTLPFPVTDESDHEDLSRPAPPNHAVSAWTNLQIIRIDKPASVDIRGSHGLSDLEVRPCRYCHAMISIFSYDCPNCGERTPWLMYDG